jgi:DNA repair photolyase
MKNETIIKSQAIANNAAAAELHDLERAEAGFLGKSQCCGGGRIAGLIGEQPNLALIQRNKFQFKSLSNWSFNPVFGCLHGCPFCYVPNTAAIWAQKRFEKLGLVPAKWIEERLAGRHWADFYWGKYAFIRSWDEGEFLESLRTAEKASKLPPDGHRAVIFSSTTDPYQIFVAPGDPELAKRLTTRLGEIVRRALELILEKSTLNVRILTRSPLAKRDFDLYAKFGKRLMFGMSLPTLDDKLSQIYEPSAPGPEAKLKTLRAAKEAGLNVYVAMAPTVPDESEDGLKNLLETVADLRPATIYHEPINLRADNAARIALQAAMIGRTVRTDVFETTEAWREYAFERLALVEELGRELNLPAGVLHSWPDADLASRDGFLRMKLAQFQRQRPGALTLAPALLKAAETEWQESVQPWINYWQSPAERIASWPGVREPVWK